MTTVNVSSISSRTVQVSYLGAYTGAVYPSVTMVSPITDDPASVAYQTTHPVVAGDIFEWDDVNSLNVSVDSSGLVSADTEGTFQGRWFDDGDQVYGDWETYTFEVPVTVSPQGSITVGTITKDTDSASVPFTYSLSDADSFEHSLDGINYTTVTSPINLVGLTDDTTYTGYIRAVNAIGAASPQQYTFTTDAIPVVPQGEISFSFPQTTQTTAQITFFYSLSDETGFEYSVDGGAWQSTGKPLSLSGLTQETTYNVRIRAVNAAGAGPAFSINARTKAPAAPSTPDDWMYSKGIRYSATANWSWGKRHPKTGMRTRVYK